MKIGRADVAALGVAALLWLGCGTPSSPLETDSVADVPSGASAAPVDTVLVQSHSGLRDADRRVIREEDPFEAWWSEAQAAVDPPPVAPAVDFDRRMVVAAAMGQRSTGGYAIEIVDARREDEELWVTVRETSPGDGCAVTQAMTAPVVAVAVPAVAGEVHFVEEESTRSC